MVVWAKPVSGEKTGPNPTDRGKSGTKKSLAVEATGGPLGVVIAGANIPDVQLLEETLGAIVVDLKLPQTNRNIYVWIKAMINPWDMRWLNEPIIPGISDPAGRKKKTARPRTNAIPPDAGSLNAPWLGYKRVAGS